jgi:hypothetical protein
MVGWLLGIESSGDEFFCGTLPERFLWKGKTVNVHKIMPQLYSSRGKFLINCEMAI